MSSRKRKERQRIYAPDQPFAERQERDEAGVEVDVDDGESWFVDGAADELPVGEGNDHA